MAAIDIKNMDFGYNEDLVLHDCNVTIEEGEFVLILGGNGSGKSTFLKVVLGELKPRKGEVNVLNKPISSYTSYKEIGYVPQINVVNSIAFPITCLELVTLNEYEDFGWLKIPRKVHYDKAKEVLREMGMEKYIHRPVNELSGGLQQRAMICRALINRPKLLILDEPTAGVDRDNKENFIRILKELNKDRGITVVMVTHEQKEIESITEVSKTYKIEDGVIISC